VNLYQMRTTVKPLSDSQLWTRISLVPDLLRVSEGRGLDLAQSFASLLAKASHPSSIPSSDLETVVRRVRDEESRDKDILLRFERKALGLLRRSETGWIDRPTNSASSEP
jgi:hypothetical protein